MENEVHSYYGNKVRVRVCGLCQLDKKILLINHSSITKNSFWAPPGGGLKFGESAEDCIKREFIEETGLTIEIEKFLFTCEFIQHPLHAIELFFKVKTLSYNLKMGTDPERGSPNIIKEVKFKSVTEIQAIPINEIHGIFKYAAHPLKVELLSGFFKL
jgi:8-oxo-dGTP diphosphatase